MTSLIDKARGWRQRAEELRADAEQMVTPAARTSLREMAAALEHHAEILETTAFKFSRARRRAAAVSLACRLVLGQSAIASGSLQESD